LTRDISEVKHAVAGEEHEGDVVVMEEEEEEEVCWARERGGGRYR
jgi:hypothetical protein